MLIQMAAALKIPPLEMPMKSACGSQMYMLTYDSVFPFGVRVCECVTTSRHHERR